MASKARTDIVSFEQWWELNHLEGRPIDAKTVWDAAVALERAACADLCAIVARGGVRTVHGRVRRFDHACHFMPPRQPWRA